MEGVVIRFRHCAVSLFLPFPYSTFWKSLCTVRVGPGSKLSAKNLCFWTVVLDKTLESPLDCKEIKPVHSEGDQPWAFIGRTDAEAETPVLWPPHAKS